MLVGVLDRHANVCTDLFNAIVEEQLFHVVIKKKKKKNYIFITYSRLIEIFHSAVVVG